MDKNLIRYFFALFCYRYFLYIFNFGKNHFMSVTSIPVISVAMPIYNGALFLPEALDSLLAQTFSNFEIIALDDGSTDDSLSILRKYQEIDPRIKVISRKNQGAVITRNELLSMAAGKWIAWMDQDDISLPNRFERQIEVLEKSNGDICGCHWIVINEAGRAIDAKLVPLDADSFTVCLAKTVPFAHGSVMMRRQFILENNLWYSKDKVADDYDLWLKFYESSANFVNVNEFLFKYRDYSTSLSKRKYEQLMSDTKLLRKQFLQKNHKNCEVAVKNLTCNFNNLNLSERVDLLLVSFNLSLYRKNLSFLRIMKIANRRTIVMAFLELLR